MQAGYVNYASRIALKQCFNFRGYTDPRDEKFTPDDNGWETEDTNFTKNNKLRVKNYIENIWNEEKKVLGKTNPSVIKMYRGEYLDAIESLIPHYITPKEPYEYDKYWSKFITTKPDEDEFYECRKVADLNKILNAVRCLQALDYADSVKAKENAGNGKDSINNEKDDTFRKFIEICINSDPKIKAKTMALGSKYLEKLPKFTRRSWGYDSFRNKYGDLITIIYCNKSRSKDNGTDEELFRIVNGDVLNMNYFTYKFQKPEYIPKSERKDNEKSLGLSLDDPCNA